MTGAKAFCRAKLSSFGNPESHNNRKTEISLHADWWPVRFRLAATRGAVQTFQIRLVLAELAAVDWIGAESDMGPNAKLDTDSNKIYAYTQLNHLTVGRPEYSCGGAGIA